MRFVPGTLKTSRQTPSARIEKREQREEASSLPKPLPRTFQRRWIPNPLLADGLQVLLLHLLERLIDGLALEDNLLDTVLDRLLQLAPVLRLRKPLRVGQLILKHLDKRGALHLARGEEVLPRLHRARFRPEEAAVVRHVVDEAPPSEPLVGCRVLVDAVVER